MVRNTNRHGHASPSGLEDDRDDDQAELEDGESRDGDGGVRPVPPGVDDQDALEGDDDELTDEEMIEAVVDEPERFIRSFNQGTQETLDRSLIEMEFDVGRRRSKRVKSGALAELDDDRDDDQDELELLGDDRDDELTDEEMIEAVVDGPERFIRSFNQGTQETLDRSRIEIEFDVGRRRSKRVKSGALAELDRELM